MNSFGDRLKHERLERGLSVQAASEILNVNSDHLFALERNDFDALPDDGTIKDWLQAYAECLEVDAELMIEDYLRERDHCLQELDDAVTERAAVIPVAPAPVAVKRRPASRRLHVTGVLLVGIAIGAWWMFSGDGTVPPPAAPGEETLLAGEPLVETSVPTQTEQPMGTPSPSQSRQPMRTASPVEERTAPQTTSTRSTAPIAAASIVPDRPSRLDIPDHGVGTGIENRQLVGRSDRFSEGSEVWFWTHVQGGSPGDTIHHVWLQQGVERWRIALRIGGSRWRTHSTKKLHPGSRGEWTVEARNETGRVLARQKFVCVR